ncbi:hypothetical protein EXIGLDRAFT_723615 [Exidia glandulosa HHB12029]|uniref:histidine kinase n=1 Tax=Exidia glandulosa HHB12029 TaxID=1314781 RepID=A0A165ESQ1_EXIGL|nr:hypothetical protein EXIGLDRAFT_723615 [Exidia glandulosa HHB12029]
MAAAEPIVRDAAYEYEGGPGLPYPASSSSRKRRIPLVRISQTPLRVHWAKIRHKFGTASAPSESLVDGSTTEASSHAPLAVAPQIPAGANEDEAPVDVVVVDREFHLNGTETAPSTTASRNSREKSATGSFPGGHGGIATTAGAESSMVSRASIFSRLVPRSAIRGVHHFFDMGSELQPNVERQYRKEQWHLSKRLALMSSLFFVLNWILGVAFILRPLPLPDKIVYYGIFPVLSVPLPFLVAFDFPRDHNRIYQIYLALCIWAWSTYMAIYINLCSFYGNTPEVVHSTNGLHCNGKDFIGLFYYTTALQTIGLFALHQNRTAAVASATSFFVVLAAAVVPHKTTMARQAINFVVYEIFVIYAHYKKESSDRRLYHMREELKNQYRATQKAQVAERKAGDSKRRLTSYIFHEVRVPLNTAMLATQNMEAGGAVPKAQEIEFRALQGSLGMMSKVLNDVLDFNRMDAGRFESVARPYALHTAIQSMFSPLKLAAEAKGVEAELYLDPRVDEVAREAARMRRVADGDEEKHERDDEKVGEPGEEEAGIVIGDEMRLRQIVNNLTSNATKFTPSGGRITVTTRLIHPAPGATLGPVHQGSDQRMVVRIEVRDTGVGIRGRDLADGGRRLFSPYVQTEIGRVQGGKGSGLGLALVRHIVRLSHGRLGVRSKVNEGSTFWVELSLGVGVGADALAAGGLPAMRGRSEGGGTMSDSSGGGAVGMLFPVTRRTAGVARLSAGVAEFERAMVARRPDPVLEEPPKGSASQLLRQTTRRSAHRQNSYGQRGYDAEPSPASVPSTYLGSTSPARDTSPSEELSSITPDGKDPIGRFSPISPGSMSLGSIPPPSSIEPPPIHDLTPTAAYAPDYNFTPLPPPRGRGSALPTPDSLPSASVGGSPGPSPFVPSPSPFVPSSPSPPQPQATVSPSLAMPPGLIAGTASGMGQGTEKDGRMRVLVVDDDGLTRRLMGRMLARLGCVVDTAEHGQQALEMILANAKGDDSVEPYSVTFLDNQMHVMSGLEMVSRLRELGREDFVVGVTGNALLSDQEEYITAGVDHVLTKPVMEQSLKVMLSLAHERTRQLRRKSGPARADDQNVDHRDKVDDAPSSPAVTNGTAQPASSADPPPIDQLNEKLPAP